MNEEDSASKEPTALPETKRNSLEVFNVLGTENVAFGAHLVEQVCDGTWLGNSDDPIRRMELAEASFLALKELAPRDSVEGMLASQMISAHNAAMECFRRAMSPQQSLEGRESNLKHAEKLIKLYTQQIDALEKYRGKRHHKMTVEQVNVEAGGQAIVGDVHHSGGAPNSKKNDA